MSDTVTPPQGTSEPDDADRSSGADAAGSSVPKDTATTGGDHHGLLAFLGALALVLLFVAAVGAAWTGGSGSDDGRQAATPTQGHASGQEKHAEKAERKAQRQAERQERKARQREQQRQRRMGMMGPQMAEALTEQRGTLATQVAADGATVYVLQTANGTLTLDIGPARFWGEHHPLAPLVGQMVTVTGIEDGSDHLAVYSINGEVIRGPGRPPWAGGWKVGGQKVPTTSPSVGPSPSVSPGPSPSATP